MKSIPSKTNSSILVRSMIVLAVLIATTAFLLSPPPTHANSVPLYSFSGSDGAYPFAGLAQGSDGDFYGTTGGGGASSCGTVFKITSGGNLTTLYSFDGSDGATPYAGLVQGSDGNFYGTTVNGGASGKGTVFRITSGGSLTTLYSLGGSDRANPYAGLVQGSDGDFYGTTLDGGDGYGTVFKITSGGSLTTLHSFNGSDGARPFAGLVQAGGHFYGTTYNGGYGYLGTVFKITSGGSFTTLHVFSGYGAFPYGGLVQGSDGNLYGTTSDNDNVGPTQYGTVFKITSGGSLTSLYSFNNSDGGIPYAGLVQGSDGNFYGTTVQGGATVLCWGGCGTEFKITSGGSLTTLYSFSYSDGATPYAGLVQGNDGNFYGTTAYGGASGYGTVFKITLPSNTVPTNKDQCKNGGWATFTSPRTFKNEGDCIQFVNTGK